MLPDAFSIRKETEEEKKGLFSRFSKSESAAATVIIAILLLGLVFTIISVVRLEYVPEWKDDAEQDHAYDIWDDMLGVKENIDMLSRLMESGNYSANSFSATEPFIIGGGEIPVFESSKSNGKLEINTERCRMTLKPYITNKTVNPYYVLDCGGISCYSGNRQYPNQIFRYENGVLILADGKSSIMKQAPVFTIEENKMKKGNYNVSIRAVQLLGKPSSVSSNTLTPLRLTGLGATTIYNSSTTNSSTTNSSTTNSSTNSSNSTNNTSINNTSINSTSVDSFDLTIVTKYPDAWFVYFNEIAQNKGLENGTDYTVELYPNKLDPDSVRFSFLPNSNKTLENLYVSKAAISAEIIPIRYQNVMKLNQWYCFNTASNHAIDLSPLMDSGSPVDFKVQNTTGKYLNSNYLTNNVFHYRLGNNDSFESIFGFSGFTELESQPSSVTVLMIYQLPSETNMTLAGKTLPIVADNYKNKWYIYKQIVSGISISDPSDLKFSLKINSQKGVRDIDIDYLAVCLN